MVCDRGLLVLGNGCADEPALVVADSCIRAAQVGLAGPQRLDFRAQQFKARLELLDKLEVVIGLFVDRCRPALVVARFLCHLGYDSNGRQSLQGSRPMLRLWLGLIYRPGLDAASLGPRLVPSLSLFDLL